MKTTIFLQKWADKLVSLKQGGVIINGKSGKAPHKPVLLLSLIQLAEELNLQENQLPINERLFEIFKQTWYLLVGQESKKDVITYPINHLQNEGFWTVIQKDGERLDKKLSSEAQLLKKIDFGFFDPDLWQLIIAPRTRPLIKMIILDFYFPETKGNHTTAYDIPEYFSELEAMIFEDQQAEYRKSTRTEEGFVRNWKFRNAVLRVYDFTCCISKLSFDPPLPIIEACHIRPFADSGINHITNGIPLCINLHRAFDAGILSFTDDFQVLIKGKNEFKEQKNSPYNLRQFEGSKILLPKKEIFNPSLKMIKWHRDFHGF